MPKSSDENLRLEIRARLASGALFPTGRRIFAGKGTGKPCIVCGRSIAPSEIEHEIVGPTTVLGALGLLFDLAARVRYLGEAGTLASARQDDDASAAH